MNPLQTLYNNYTENTANCCKFLLAFNELYKNTEIRTHLDELMDGVCEDEEKAFNAGFKTAVQLLMGADQE